MEHIWTCGADFWAGSFQLRLHPRRSKTVDDPRSHANGRAEMHEIAARQLFWGCPTETNSHRPRSEHRAFQLCPGKRSTTPNLMQSEAAGCMRSRLVNCFRFLEAAWNSTLNPHARECVPQSQSFCATPIQWYTSNTSTEHHELTTR